MLGCKRKMRTDGATTIAVWPAATVQVPEHDSCVALVRSYDVIVMFACNRPSVIFSATLESKGSTVTVPDAVVKPLKVT